MKKNGTGAGAVDLNKKQTNTGDIFKDLSDTSKIAAGQKRPNVSKSL